MNEWTTKASKYLNMNKYLLWFYSDTCKNSWTVHWLLSSPEHTHTLKRFQKKAKPLLLLLWKQKRVNCFLQMGKHLFNLVIRWLTTFTCKIDLITLPVTVKSIGVVLEMNRYISFNIFFSFSSVHAHAVLLDDLRLLRWLLDRQLIGKPPHQTSICNFFWKNHDLV